MEKDVSYNQLKSATFIRHPALQTGYQTPPYDTQQTNMGDNKKDMPPSVSTILCASEERQPSLSQDPQDSGSESDESEATESLQTPLAKLDFRQMLREAIEGIKTHTAACSLKSGS
ncbi:Hypothetical predicted protein [Pelobates cultripes]|uniref:Uncharacterized protein n=1 Tax=Pelobates cultripes TaxID=61616 RepID=A0AAD1VTV3_PELCU|nr:Hypothetical predicted protein [Pelobates cultripes]